jgi:hypothetical protein
MRALARVKCVGGKGGASANGSTTKFGGMNLSTNMTGEERERRVFTEALRCEYEYYNPMGRNSGCSSLSLPRRMMPSTPEFPLGSTAS